MAIPLGVEIGRAAKSDLLDIEHAMDRMVDEMGRDIYTEARIAGRNLAVDLARHTGPRGSGKGDGKPGEVNIAKDVAKVYATVGFVYQKLKATDEGVAERMLSAYMDRKFAKVREILGGTSFADLEVGARINADLHRSARSGSGRVESKRPKQMVLNAGARKRYAKKVGKRVGTAKSGWAHAAKELGSSRGIPAWAGTARHKKKLGGAVKKKRGLNPGVIIENTARHVRPSLDSILISSALRDTADRLLKRMRAARYYDYYGAKGKPRKRRSSRR